MATRKTKANQDEVFNSLIAMHKAAQKLNLSKVKTRKGPSAEAVDVCGVYKKIRPVLELISNFPLIPKKIKEAVKLLMATLDTICPS